MLSPDIVGAVTDIVTRVLCARGELPDLLPPGVDETWNSAASVEIVLGIEAHYGIRLDTREVVAARTISSMVAVVSQVVAAAAERNTGR